MCLFFPVCSHCSSRPQPGGFILIQFACVGLSLVPSLQTAGSPCCSDPPVFCLRWPTPTPCSFFLRTRKRLALLTPSRGLALAGQEKRPPGWAGHRGREAGREGVRLWCDRPAAVSVAVPVAEGGERWAGLETPLLLQLLSRLVITAHCIGGLRTSGSESGLKDLLIAYPSDAKAFSVESDLVTPTPPSS